MSECPHEYHEREASVYADGLCPLCMRTEIERLHRIAFEADDKRCHVQAEIERLQGMVLMLEKTNAPLLAARTEIERLRERLGPRGLEVVVIDGAGHYVNAKVKVEVERLRALLAQCRPLVAASRSWKATPLVEKIDAVLSFEQKGTRE